MSKHQHKRSRRDMIYWFTGQPGAGKSTLAAALVTELRRRGVPAVHLDGEELREITENSDFTEQGRIRNICAGQKLAAALDRQGISVAASFVSPYRRLREEFKRNPRVVEIYVHTTEPRGKESFFVETYEAPLSDYIDIDTSRAAVAESLDQILRGIARFIPQA